METFMELVGWVRNRRAELGLKPKETASVHLGCEDPELADFLAEQAPLARQLAALDTWEVASDPPAGASRDRVAGIDVAFLVAGRDLEAEERRRLETELAELAPQIERLESLLANDDFTAKAPADVVARNRRRLDELEARRGAIGDALGGGRA
jgi:valyl-tRNA synthetase